jgi:hypothetical protein
MARLSDHDFRDAQASLNAEIRLLIGQYVRRMAETGKAYIQEELELAEKEEVDVNGTAIGRAAAEKAARDWFNGYGLAGSQPHAAIEGKTSSNITD